jgi:hypothetical protein
MVNDWPIINLFFNQRKVENMKDNGKDDIPYMKWKSQHIPNHQPVIIALNH